MGVNSRSQIYPAWNALALSIPFPLTFLFPGGKKTDRGRGIERGVDNGHGRNEIESPSVGSREEKNKRQGGNEEETWWG